MNQLPNIRTNVPTDVIPELRTQVENKKVTNPNFNLNDHKIEFKKNYWKSKTRMILMAIIIFGAINWGAEAVGYNLVKMLSDKLNTIFKSNIPIDKIIYIVVALAGIKLAMCRNTWLPFLGKSVLPSTLLSLRTPKNANYTVKIQTKPNSMVAYWASLPNDEKVDPITAYSDFSNSGVVMSDASGMAELKIIEGNGYTLPYGRKLHRHVHYRLADLYNGMMGRINTVKY